MVVDAGPDVVAHNIETVRRLTPIVRDWRAGYEKSLKVLKLIKDINPDIITKSGILLGLGEGFDEVLETFKDLRSVGVDIVTIGQYLSPSKRHFPVVEYVSPDIFRRLEEAAYRLGFKYVASGPRVRSSYLAGEYFISRLLKGRG
jgi:lipoic acid synthetase